MSQIDTFGEEKMLSETTAGTGEEKLVPVSESIRYRKRAQAAEKTNEVLTEQLAETQKQVSQIRKQLGDIEDEQKLIKRLADSGVVDMEAAVLLTKARVKDSNGADFDDVIAELKKEKQYLFSETKTLEKVGAAAKRTAGAKDGIQNSQTVLERAAKKAATTGNRVDLHEYLRLRRNFI